MNSSRAGPPKLLRTAVVCEALNETRQFGSGLAVSSNSYPLDSVSAVTVNPWGAVATYWATVFGSGANPVGLLRKAVRVTRAEVGPVGVKFQALKKPFAASAVWMLFHPVMAASSSAMACAGVSAG